MGVMLSDKEKQFKQLLRDACIRDRLQLWDAAESEYGLATGEFINACGIVDRCMFHESLHILRRCRERGADLSYPGVDGATPIHVAAQNDNVKMVSALLDHGVSIETEIGVVASTFRIGGCTPLHLAAWEGSGQCVKFLLERGANRHALCSNKQTPLKRAFVGGITDGVLLALLQHGEDEAAVARLWREHWPRSEPLTPFQVAVRCGLARTVEYYLTERGEDPNQLTGRGTSLLKLAAKGDKQSLPAVRAVILSHRSTALIADAVGARASHMPARAKLQSPSL